MSYDPYDGEYYERELDLLEPDNDHYEEGPAPEGQGGIPPMDYFEGASIYDDGMRHYEVRSKKDLRKLPPAVKKAFLAQFEGEDPFDESQEYDIAVDYNGAIEIDCW